MPRVLPILFFCLFLFIYFFFFFPEHESTRNNGLFVPRKDRAALCSGAARTETQNVLRTVYATLNELYDSRASEVRTWSCHGARARYSKTRGIDDASIYLRQRACLRFRNPRGFHSFSQSTTKLSPKMSVDPISMITGDIRDVPPPLFFLIRWISNLIKNRN